MVFFGKLSYSLYLWHWGVIVLFKNLPYPLRDVNHHVVNGIILVLVFLLSMLSYYLIENKTRNYKHTPKIVLAGFGLIIGINATFLRVSFLKTFTKFPKIKLIDNNSSVSQSLAVDKSNRYFDELEIRLLKTIISQGENGLDIAQLNTLLNLKKLSDENQRQRRHIILKELNLKLFLLFGIREGIIRIEIDLDKRRKSYVLNKKINKTQIESIFDSE
jgi:DNA-binding transcriptional MerR regulator